MVTIISFKVRVIVLVAAQRIDENGILVKALKPLMGFFIMWFCTAE